MAHFMAFWDSYFLPCGLEHLPISLGPLLYLLYIPCFHYSSFEELNNWEVSGTIFQAYDEWLGCTAYSCGALRVSVTRVGGADACKESSGWFFEHEDKYCCHICAYCSLWFVSYFVSCYSKCSSLYLGSK